VKVLKVYRCNELGVCMYVIFSGKSAVREIIRAYEDGRLEDVIIVPNHAISEAQGFTVSVRRRL